MKINDYSTEANNEETNEQAVIAPEFKESEFSEIVIPKASRTPEPVIGITAGKSVWFDGVGSARYPTDSTWFDIDTLNTDLYKVYQSKNGSLIQPQTDGLYRIEFYSSFYAVEPSSISVWILKQPGNFEITYINYDLVKGQSIGIDIARLVRLTRDESICVAVRQFNANGKLRAWTGSTNPKEAKKYSGLYLTKL